MGYVDVRTVDDDSSLVEEERVVDEGTVVEDEGTVEDDLSVMDEEVADDDDEPDEGIVVDERAGIDEEAADIDDKVDEGGVEDEETVVLEETSVVGEDSVLVDDSVVPDEGVGARYTLPWYFPPKVRFTTLRTHRTCLPHIPITTSLPLLARALTHLLPPSTTSLTKYTHPEGLAEAREGVEVCGGV